MPKRPNQTADFPRGIRLAWCYWEVLRRLGFSADDIFVGVVGGDFFGRVTQVVRVELRAQDREFGIHVEPWGDDPTRFEPTWAELCACLADGRVDDHVLVGWLDEHLSEIPVAQLTEAILAKGIHVPRHPIVRTTTNPTEHAN